MIDKLLVILQGMLPHHAISRLTGWIAATRWRPAKNSLIWIFTHLYKIELDEAQETNPYAYDSFNAFFTRSLKSAARPIDYGEFVVVSPVDGRLSQAGRIDNLRLIQAKGRDYNASDLLARDALAYNGGVFATIYLAPHNYHRIHMPLDATLVRMTYVPGRLYSVSPSTARGLEQLFARNERVVFEFTTAIGPMALVMVGAMNVGSIETVHAGIIAPARVREVREWDYTPGLHFAKGAELGRFNLGSTVILLFGPDQMELGSHLIPGAVVRVGAPVGQLTDSR